MTNTIAAVSTPRGKGGIAVIRISGEGTDRVLDRIFVPFGKKSLSERGERVAVYGEIISPADGTVLDCGIATRYKSPASYTGEDMAELSCHGGVFVTRAVLAAALEAGARLAEAGEFTRRAFLNGKLTLTEAEAVGELLDADTEERLRLAASAVGGRLSDELAGMTERLTGVMSALYAAIDYPEEDVGDEGEREIGSVMREVKARAERLLSTYRRGKAVTGGVKCVICGKPNAGKSSLYNAICGENEAIVTDVAGTTRDVLKTRVSFGGVTLELCDTAGLRDTSDTVESIGVERAEREIGSAELLICVFDSSAPLTDGDRRLISDSAAARIAVVNKSDLESRLTSEDESLIGEKFDKIIRVSCETGDGIDELAAAVGELYDSGKVELGEDAVIWSVRHEASLRRAVGLLTAAIGALDAGEPIDAVCTLCEGAAAELGETDGRGVSEEIVSGIFSRFCVGK